MSTNELILLATLAVLGAALVCQLVYWGVFMFRVRRKPRYLASGLPGVSVIVCAKNEEANLKRLVPALLSQKYAAEKQIVVVDDCSTDDTPMTLAQMRAQYPELYTTTIENDSKFKHGKKLALTVGIKAAKFEHMVFIDADCMPASDNWLTSIVECYSENGKEMVLGYGRYAKHPGLLNLYIRYETFWNAVQYMGIARAFRPFMGVGRNLSYTKTLFNRSSKFRNNLSLLSGDDDLFVSEMGTKKNTVNCFIAPSHTVSEPKTSWLQYSAQKSRHMTTSSLYPMSIKALLFWQEASRALYWLALVAALLMALLWQQPEQLLWGLLAAFLVRTILIYISMGMSAKNMGESKMWLLALPMDICVPLVQCAAWITGVMTQSRNTWK